MLGLAGSNILPHSGQFRLDNPVNAYPHPRQKPCDIAEVTGADESLFCNIAIRIVAVAAISVQWFPYQFSVHGALRQHTIRIDLRHKDVRVAIAGEVDYVGVGAEICGIAEFAIGQDVSIAIEHQAFG